MTRIYRVSSTRNHPHPGYYRRREEANLAAQARADEDRATIEITMCRVIDLPPPELAIALLSRKDWCCESRIVRYVKPRTH